MTASEALKQERRQRFGRRLRKLRQESGLTQERLAHDAGLDRSFYVQVENGVHSIALDRVFDISDALGVDIRTFF